MFWFFFLRRGLVLDAVRRAAEGQGLEELFGIFFLDALEFYPELGILGGVPEHCYAPVV